jgi:hypothetical protein
MESNDGENVRQISGVLPSFIYNNMDVWKIIYRKDNKLLQKQRVNLIRVKKFCFIKYL